jgi:hypothetical protein
MKSIAIISALTALFVSSLVQAQPLTRADVHQQLIEAQANGSAYVTDSSYPAVHPSFTNRVGSTTLPSGYGGVADESRSAAPAATHTPNHAHGSNSHRIYGSEECVGPVSFCNIYAGS